MTLTEIKEYLVSRINAYELLELTDEDLSKYMTTAINILDTFYGIGDYELLDSELVPVVAEEMIFLFNSNIDLNLFYQYEGLTSFNIGKGAVQGAVDYKNKGDLFSRYVKAMLERLGISPIVEDPNLKVKNSFTWL